MIDGEFRRPDDILYLDTMVVAPKLRMVVVPGMVDGCLVRIRRRQVDALLIH